MAKKPKETYEPIEGEFYVSKKIQKVFKELFQTVFDRRLSILYTAFAEDDIYIVSDVSPYYLMSGTSRGSFGFIDLRKEDEEIRDGIRKMVLSLVPGRDYAVRTDYLTQLINNYKGKVFPLPVEAVNQDREDVFVFWRRDGIANYSEQKIKSLIGDKDRKDPNKFHLLKAAWASDGGFFNHPLRGLLEKYKSFIERDDLKADFIPGDRSDTTTPKQFEFAGNVYQIVPVPGVDTLQLDKIKGVEGSRTLLHEESARIFTYASFAVIGKAEVLLTRPDIILYPIKRSEHEPRHITFKEPH